jgi:glycosyltransferase involved in cell wall biosynthesis
MAVHRFGAATTGPEPAISIVVPTFDRPILLRKCLEAIAALDPPGMDFEVVVVNDGGTDDLHRVVGAFATTLSLQLVTQRRGGPGAARNAGAAVARGRYLAFIDDDCRPAREWLVVLRQELQRDERRLLGGRVENALVANPYSEASEWINAFVYEYNRDATAREPFFTTNNVAVSARLFREVGGFATAVPTAEDKEFCVRWRAKGLPLSHIPEAVVYHAHDLTFARFWRQHYNYGRGSLAFRLGKRKPADSHVLPEGVRFYAKLVLSPLRARPEHRVRLVWLLIVSQLATLAGGVRQALQWATTRSDSAPDGRS